MNSVEDLDVFKLAHESALKIYSVTKKFPREETYSLIDQMRRAAASVGMNLVEGSLRLSSREYRQFVGIARGSAGEVCYQLLLAKDLQYISEEVYRELRAGYDRVVQMLSRLSQRSIASDEHNSFHESRSRFSPDTITARTRPRHFSDHVHGPSPTHAHGSYRYEPRTQHFSPPRNTNTSPPAPESFQNCPILDCNRFQGCLRL